MCVIFADVANLPISSLDRSSKRIPTYRKPSLTAELDFAVDLWVLSSEEASEIPR